jgi:hypothetical protein
MFNQQDPPPIISGTIKKGISFENEKKYLALSWYLLNVSWKPFVARVKDAVEAVMNEYVEY